MTTLSREQAAELLKYRCGLISYDGVIDHAALRVGSPSACLPILRFLFINFSEALDNYFSDEAGHTFHQNMTNREMVAGIMYVWDQISPEASIGAMTVAKMMQPDEWGTDRVQFTLQCVWLCCRKHRELVAESEEAWLQGGLSWTSDSPQQQFGPNHHPLVGTESERERSTVAWMAEAYREQMATLELSQSRTPLDGTAEQQMWVERFLRGDAKADTNDHAVSMLSKDSSSVDSVQVSVENYASARTSNTSGSSLRLSGGGGTKSAYHGDEPRPDVAHAMLTPAAHQVIFDQLAHAGVAHLANPTRDTKAPTHGVSARARSAFARHYQELMHSLRFTNVDRRSSLGERDSFDDSLFDIPFIGDEPVPPTNAKPRGHARENGSLRTQPQSTASEQHSA